MIRLTFQFVPFSFTETDKFKLKNEYIDSKSGDPKRTEITIVQLRDARLEVAASGSIRYSVNSEEISEEILNNVYNKAQSSLSKVLLEGPQIYRVSLIIGEMESYDQYHKNRDHIAEFSSTVFGSEEPEYTELNEQSVKISFGPDRRKISI